MRVLVLSHVAPVGRKGGGERYVEDLGRALPRAGVEARVEEATHFDGNLSGFDLVHVPTSDVRLSRRARRSGLPVVVTFHAAPFDMARHGYATGRGGIYRVGQSAAYAWNVLETSAAIAFADAVTCQSERTMGSVRRQAPWAARKLHLVEGAVDVSRYAATGEDEGYVLFVGRLEKSKGIDLAVRALSGSGFPFKVAGTGALAGDLRARAGPDVEFLGEVSDGDLLALYQRASVCVFPSLMEGYGLVALEALACGTPTVVSEAFAVRGPAARLLDWIPVRDEKAILQAVAARYGTKTREWSRLASETVHAHHSTARMAAELKDVYAHAIRARGREVPA